MRLETHYGKAQVSTYRTSASALDRRDGDPRVGVPGSAEPRPRRRDRRPGARRGLHGRVHRMATTRMVVATDTMKNFIHRESLAFGGSTLEGWLFFLGRRFLETYPQMERLRVSGEEIRFDPARVPSEGGGFADSDVLFHRRHDDRGVAALEVGRAADGSVVLGDLRAGRVGLDLMKTTGSAFADFPRDEYTTLPSRKDRLLFTHMDIAWRYADAAHRGRAGAGALRPSRPGRRPRGGRLPPVREPLDPAPRPRDRAADVRAVPGARRGVVRGPEPDVRPGRERGRRRAEQGLHGPAAAVRADRADDAAGRLAAIASPSAREVLEPVHVRHPALDVHVRTSSGRASMSVPRPPSPLSSSTRDQASRMRSTGLRGPGSAA